MLVLILVSFQANALANGNMTDTNYDPVFDEVIDAEDREKAAERTGVSYRDGDVHAVVEMSPDEEVQGEVEIPSGYGIDVVQESEIENRTLVEAWIDADDIRDLAAEEKVERVRQPVGPVPATSEIPPEETNGTDANGEGEGDGEEPDRDNGDGENDDGNQPLSGFTYAIALLALLLAASGRRVLR